MQTTLITANGQPIVAKLPSTIEEFLVTQGWLLRSVGESIRLPEC